MNKTTSINLYSQGLSLFIILFFNTVFIGTIQAQSAFCGDEINIGEFDFPNTDIEINVSILPTPTTDATVDIGLKLCGDFDGAFGGFNDESIMLEDETMMPLITVSVGQCAPTEVSFTITLAQYNSFVADGVFTVTVIGGPFINPNLCTAPNCNSIQLCFPSGGFSITSVDPCVCTNPLNILTTSCEVLLFHDVITIPPTIGIENQTVTIANASNFVDADGNPITSPLGTTGSDGSFSFDFYHAAGVAATADVIINGIQVEFVSSICDEITAFDFDIVGDTQLFCSGIPTTLSTTAGSSFLWSTGETTPSITVSPTETTTYTVAVSDTECGCTVEKSVEVVVGDCVPIPTMGQWGLICLGLLLLIFGVVSIKQRKVVVG